MAAFAPGSVSLRLYPHDLPATARLDELETQAALAIGSGFDGVMLSERHGGAWGQIPNPLLVAGLILAAVPGGWAAPAPLLLNLRRPATVAEDVAWLAARHPGRIGIGFGSGGNQSDFELVGAPFASRARDFARDLATVVGILRGQIGYGNDAAIEEAATHNSIPMLSMAMSHTAARRAATLGLGLMGSSLLSIELTRAIADTYRAAGGTGVHVLIRRVWLGAPPRALIERQLAHYRQSAGAAALSEADELICGDPTAIADALIDAARRAEASALNVRIHVPGVTAGAAREQIEGIAREVVPKVRHALAG